MSTALADLSQLFKKPEDSRSSTTFHPGVSVIEKNNKNTPIFRHDISNDRFPPNNIKKGALEHEGVQYNYYMKRANDEKDKISGLSGFKSDYPLSPKRIQDLADNNTSYFCLALANPRRTPGFMKHFEAVGRGLVRGEIQNKDYQDFVKGDTPLSLFGHSTGGQVELTALNDPETVQIANEMYDRIDFSSPYLGSTSDAMSKLKHASLLFNALAFLSQDKLPIETPWGNRYLAYKDPKRYKDKNPLEQFAAAAYALALGEKIPDEPGLGFVFPTLPQIQEINEHGQTLIAALKNPESPIHQLAVRTTFWLGEKDPFSHPDIGKKATELLKNTTAHVTPDSQHIPLENEETFQKFVSVRKSATDTKPLSPNTPDQAVA